MSLRDILRAAASGGASGETGTAMPPQVPAAPRPEPVIPLPTAIPLTPEAAARAAALEVIIPRLSTPRCTLRAPRLSDFDALHAITAADRDGLIGGPASPEESWAEFCAMTATWLLRGHGMWTVELSGEHGGVEPTGEHGDQIAGFVLIGTEPGDVEHELGWLFREGFRGHGLATEAASAARDHAWAALRLPSLVSYVARGNDASDRLAARLGAIPDGLAYDGQVTVWRHPRPEGAA